MLAIVEQQQHPIVSKESDRGFADATRPDDRYQALTREPRDERCHGFVAANHPGYREWQIMRRRRRDCRGRRTPRRFFKSYRSDEIVAPSRNRDDVAMAALAVAKGATQ